MLLIQGRFETRALSPNTTYEVAFVVKLNRTDSEGDSLVTLELNLPDGTGWGNLENLGQQREEWINLRASHFVMGPETVGTISFALYGTLDPQKTGLILKGVLIHPKD
ncbi:protein PHLOEM PROTEIN 2-LIKE A2 [Eucalyptus grandis]|uniref:protein PHLOEM PROTEIN 2-LIKE A2 n=1 Tax=Eucalyptus grandis TaxID=71139 RepID=UPI00192EAD87|nr:protein PHLOEM PROTEIN 2-LIKE A2 [Eucalyptus grandis]